MFTICLQIALIHLETTRIYSYFFLSWFFQSIFCGSKNCRTGPTVQRYLKFKNISAKLTEKFVISMGTYVFCIVIWQPYLLDLIIALLTMSEEDGGKPLCSLFLGKFDDISTLCSLEINSGDACGKVSSSSLNTRKYVFKSKIT